MEIKIRKACGEDIDMVAFLLKGWFEETDIPYPGFCDYTYLYLADFIYRQICIVAEIDGEIVGVLGLKEAFFPWNNILPALFCEFFLVNKQYRSFGTALKLMKRAKEIADYKRQLMFFGSMTGKDINLKNRFFKICGLKYAGGNFVYG